MKKGKKNNCNSHSLPCDCGCCNDDLTLNLMLSKKQNEQKNRDRISKEAENKYDALEIINRSE